jgi:predicted DNA-binding transcriptional regulator AlpA
MAGQAAEAGECGVKYVQQILAIHAEDPTLTGAQIAELVGCSRPLVYMTLGGQRGVRGLRAGRGDGRRLVRARIIREAAARQGVSVQTVYRHIQEWGEDEAINGNWVKWKHAQPRKAG